MLLRQPVVPDAVRVWLPDWIDNPAAVLDRVEAAIAQAKVRELVQQAELDAGAAAQKTKNAAIAAAAEALQVVEEAAAAADVALAEDLLADQVPAEEPAIAEDPVPALIASLSDPVTAVLEGLPQRDWNGTPATYILAPTTDLGVREDLDRVSSPSVRATISAAVRQTVDLEGPIVFTRLARNIGVRFGFGRVTVGRSELIIGVVPKELRRSNDLGFVWPDQLDPDTWRGYRSTPADLTRALTDIAPEEIVNAMAQACSQVRLSEIDLMRENLASFGLKRLTASTEEHLRACIAFGVKAGRLILDAEKYRQGV